MLAFNTVISYCWCACSLVPRLVHKSLGTRLVCMLLVIILGRLDLTVASEKMNGVLIYANMVKDSNDALILY